MTSTLSTDQLRRLALIGLALAALLAGILWGGGEASRSSGLPQAGDGVSLDSTSGADDVIARKGRAPSKKG